MGRFEICKIPFRMLRLNPHLPEDPSAPAAVFVLPLEAWILGGAQPRVQEGLWDSSNVPQRPHSGETANCVMPNFQEISKKREFFLASRETTVYKLEIHVLTFDFLLLRHTLGLHLAWAQLLVVYIGYWLFTLGQYTGWAVYTRPATNSTARSVSTTAALLYVQSWKEIKIRLWK